MTWLAENWFWVLFGVAFIAMHFFGHGGHGAHGAHGAHGSHGGGHCGGGEASMEAPDEPAAEKRPGATEAHRH
ncbi:MAG: DUF2933 domain-containing protein [Pseudomonadota bacterium]|nr:DUF2933 domain-containing protein [Pseudomonadota bacterium]